MRRLVAPLVGSTVCLAFALLVWPRAGEAQEAASSFETASVRANRSGTARTDGALVGGRFSMINETAWRLIAEAYADPLPLPRPRILGGPSWLDSDRFDVEGIAPLPLSRDRARLMLRALLAERFQLQVHTEKRPLPVFELVLSRTDRTFGPALRRSDVDCQALVAAGRTPPPAEPNGAPACMITFGFGRLTARGMSMGDLASVGLSRVTGRQTLDRTQLTGPFDWTVTWTPDNLPPRAPGTPEGQPVVVNGTAIDPNGPLLPTALQEQLGLRLQPATAPIDVIVIDRLERPTEN